MPVSTKNLLSVISKNKNKKLIASKIVETNPKVLPVIPKLIQDNKTTSNIEDDKFNINRGLLEDIYNRIRVLQQNNKHITKLFPDIELAIQILVSSILSPKKMTDIQLNYKLNKNIQIKPTISSKALELIKEYVNDEYELEDKLPEIVREALFESGAYVQTIIPESSVDELINTDLLASYSTEEFKQRVDYALESITAPVNILKLDHLNKEVSLENIGKNKNDFIKYLTSTTNVNLTDNVNILQFNKIKDNLSAKIIKNSLKSRTAISQESLEKVNYIDIFRQKSSNTSNKDIEFIKKKDETKRKTIGKPLISKIPTEAIIPVFIPGNESEHIGYFVLLDGSGKPLSTDMKENNINQVNNIIHQNVNNQLSPIQKAYQNLVTDMTNNVNVNDLFDMYKDVLERQIYTSIKSALYGNTGEIAEKNDIYFLMFTRALSDQKTNLLFIPKELVVYYAFQYNELGIGKTLLENLTVLSSLRAIMLFSKVMAYAKQSIDVTKVNISLDPNDPDPEKTIEQIQDSVLKLRQNFFPLGMNNPVDLLNWIQRAGLQFSYDNNPLIPNVKIDFENANLQHTVPESDLEDELRKQTIISLGLSPESVDNGFSPEFATTVVNNNILLSKRVAVYQKSLMKHVKKFLEIIIYNDEDLRTQLREFVLTDLTNIEESLTEEEKQLLNRDKPGFIEYYIDLISDSIEVELPKPDNTNLTSLSNEFDTYKEGLDKVIDSIISTEIFSEDISGELNSHIDTIRNIYKHHLLRKWMGENNYYPETMTLFNDDKEEVESMLNVITSHLTGTMRSSDKLLNIINKFKLAVNEDLKNIEGSGADEGSSSSSGSSDNSSESDNTDENSDIVSEDDFNLDL